MTVRKMILFCALATLMLGGCNSSQSAVEAAKAEKPGAPQAAYCGTVVETMNAAGYTYVQIDTGSEKIWAAGPECTVKTGERVTIPADMLKEKFHSKTLNRTFDKIYFVGSIKDTPANQKTCPVPPDQDTGGAARTAAAAPEGITFDGIKKPAGGKTVSEIHAEKNALSGKKIVFSGKVVKFNPDIMGKNWLHVQDGTGDRDTNDLAVTTNHTCSVGDTVLITGTVVLDKDFGYGYKYAILIEDASVEIIK